MSWADYYKKHKIEYNWNRWFKREDNATDHVANPYPGLFVGSEVTEIPDVNVVVNVAKECLNRSDIGSLYQYKIGLKTYQPNALGYKNFTTATLLVYSLVKAGCRVFVYCKYGIGRSIAIVATCASKLDGNTTIFEKLIDISKSRPYIDPEPCYIAMGQIWNQEIEQISW